MEDDNQSGGEIEETNPNSNLIPNPKTVKTKVPEVEINLYRQGKGPIDVFKVGLGGWVQDQLEVRDICEKYGFKSLYAFNTESGRGVPIRFSPKNGRSMLTYRDGSVIYIDGEPKDSLIQPVTKIFFGVAIMTILITLVLKENPMWIRKLNSLGGGYPPWILACVVIVFTRTRKRTKDFLKRYGW